MSWLSDYCAARRTEARRRKALRPERELRAQVESQAPPRPFAPVLRKSDGLAVIAEIKFRSPSAGELRAQRDVEHVARSYEANGASAISVLVDEVHFGGSFDDLSRARQATALPILAKGFFVDPYELLEARAAGADAVLLIAACLESEDLILMHAQARDIGLDVLVELHREEELRKLEGLDPELVGVNHRNLDTLRMDMGLTERLVPKLPSGVVKVAESGLSSPEDLARMSRVGFDAVLVGSRFMGQPDPGLALAELIGGRPCSR